MKSRDEVVALFRDKYAYLQMVCQQQIGPFNESAIYQNPDGGWQLNLEQPGTAYRAAITLRPNDEAPHETHGVIGARWFQEGGAFDVNGIPGWLGYPVKDEERREVSVCLPNYGYLPIERIPGLLAGGWAVPQQDYISIWKSSSKSVHHAFSQFEFGEIGIRDGLTWERATEELNYNTLPGLMSIVEEFPSPPYIEHLPPFGGGVPIPCLTWHSWPSADIIDKLRMAVKEGHVHGSDLAVLFGQPSDAAFIVLPEVSVTLNDSGRRHVPKDIKFAVETFLEMHGCHVVGGHSWSCDFYHHLFEGLRWSFLAEVEGFNHFSILVWREGTDIHAKIDSAPSSSFFGRSKTIPKEFTIRNCFSIASGRV